MIRISVLSVLLVIGQARAATQVGGGFDQDRAVAVYAEALAFIAPRIIDPVGIPKLTIWGLQGLTTLDPALRVTATEARLQLSRQNEILLDVLAPKDEAPAAWATAAAALTAASFPVSAPVRQAGTQGVIQVFFDEALGRLDPYSRYVPPAEAAEERGRRAGHVGLGLMAGLRGAVIEVKSVARDSPAALAGIRPGDILAAIDGRSIPPRDAATIGALLSGPEGSVVSLSWRQGIGRQGIGRQGIGRQGIGRQGIGRQGVGREGVERQGAQGQSGGRQRAERRGVQRQELEGQSAGRGGNGQGPDGRTRDARLIRALVPPETVFPRRFDDVLVLRVSGFSNSTASHIALSVQDALAEPHRVVGIVLDLRDNRGGLLRQAVTAADTFLPAGRVAATIGRDPDAMHVWHSTEGELAENVPLVILVDGNTASAAEIMAAALADRGRAVVVGSATVGKGMVQAIDPLPDGGELFVTWSQTLAPLGWPLQGLGVLPQVCTSRGQAALNRQLASLSAGFQPMTAAVQRHRAARVPVPPAEAVEIRAPCPAAEGRPADLQAASALIANPAAYAAALLSPMQDR